MRFRYFGTKELRSVPIFTRQTRISRVDCLQYVQFSPCKLMSIELLLGHTATPIRYGHINMSSCLKCPIGLIVYTSWSAHRPAPDLRTIMDRVGIDPKYKGGSVRMVVPGYRPRCTDRSRARHRPMGQLAGLQQVLQPSSS